MLEIGQPAPEFSLPNADMEDVRLSQFKGRKSVVLYFYIKDGSPGCTQQATEFTDHDQDFSKLDAVVLGVSTDDCLKHAEFRDQHGVSVELLADVEGEVCRKYGVLQPREVNGTIRYCVQRATFIIDKKGVVRHALHGVNPRGHVREVLALMRKL